MKKHPRILLLGGGGILALLVIAGIILRSNIVATPAHAQANTTLPSQFFSPYADVTVGPTLQAASQATGVKYYTLAFIGNGGNCQAEWGGTIPLDQESNYLPNLENDIQNIRSQGGDVTISFGGEAGTELARACSDANSVQAQYQAVIDHYHVNHLDFDIEGGSQGDQPSYDRRDAALAALQQANPGLTISFTLPSATTGLLDDSMGMLRNAISHGVNISVVNLMTMDYGSADSQMGQESINAANGLHNELQSLYPSKSSSQLWSMVGITPMIGQNDSAGEIFSAQDANQVLSFAQQNHIGELAYWALSRDNGSCAGGGASERCSGVSQNDYDFANIFKQFTSGDGGTTNPPPPPPTTPPSGPTPAPTTAPAPPSGSGCGGVDGWKTGVAYTGGNKVSYNGSLWQAQWWTENDVPGGPAGVWTKVGSC